MAYSPTLGRWVQQDPMGYVDGANLYETVESNPTNGLDPFGLYEIEWEGNWTTVDKQRIDDSLQRVKNRANAVRKEIHDLQRTMSECVKKEMSGQLEELERRLMDIVAGIDSATNWELRQQPLDSTSQVKNGTNASTYPGGMSGILYHDAQTTLNTSTKGNRTPWTGLTDVQLDEILLHELSHVHEPGADQDGTGHLYDPHMIDDLMSKNLSRHVNFRARLLQAQKKCGECQADPRIPPASHPFTEPSP
jgi:hypothetical protein